MLVAALVQSEDEVITADEIMNEKETMIWLVS